MPSALPSGLPPAAPPRRKHNTEAENYRKPWSEEEDGRLRALVQEHGMQQWAQIAQSMPGRNGKQCRERWHNQLDNCLTRDTWTEEEVMGTSLDCEERDEEELCAPINCKHVNITHVCFDQVTNEISQKHE